MTMIQETPSMDTTLKAPLSERINFRIIIFAGVLLFLLGWPIYTFVSETLTGGIHDRGSYKEVDLKAMGNFQFDETAGKRTDVPAKYLSLDGQKVMLQGQIYAPREAGPGITEFELVYSIQKCCFSGPPRVQERVFAYVTPATNKKNVKASGDGEHKVLGTLRVTMQRDQKSGQITEVYRLDVDSVEPA